MKRELSEDHKQKISKAVMGMKNHNWKGEDVGYSALHEWVRQRLPMPSRCYFCDEKEPHDLANKTGIYNRDPFNWWYL